jgi:Mg2+/citrate symporter
MVMSSNLEARLSLTMLGVSTLFIILSFAYVKGLNEEKRKVKVEKNKFVFEEAKDWANDTTISEEKKRYYESLID